MTTYWWETPDQSAVDAPPLEPIEPVETLGTTPPRAPDDPTPTDREPVVVAPEPKQRGTTPRLIAAFAIVALLGGVAGAFTATALDDNDSSRAIAVDRASSSLDGESLDIAGVIAKAEPSVVTISVSTRGGSGAGTGVILTADGEILTNAHVVDGASTVRVTLSGESQSREAEVVGTDPSADLALLRIPDASGLPAADLGSSDALQVGDDVVAIGNALGLRGNPTVTRGIVSGLNRSLETEGGTMTGLVQTDASISSGNSGGPLVNAAGEVVGINTAVAASNARTAAENVGFAIAIDKALPVIDRLRGDAPASADQAVLGVRISDPTDGSRGATVATVESGSAAADAGIQEGDLITKLGDDTIDGAASLSGAVRSHQPGDKVTIEIVRDGDEQTLEVTLGD